MNADAWIALAALAVTICGAIVTATFVVLSKINETKEELDQDLSAIRMSAYEEYKTLRKEIHEITDMARRDFGETINAIRSKVNEIELWTRDQLSETRHTLTGSMDMRHNIAMDKVDKNSERLRQLEMFSAAHGYRGDPAE